MKGRVLCMTPVSRFGIALTLAAHTNGVFADLSRLADRPDARMPLTVLAEGFCGLPLCATSRADTELLAARAAVHPEAESRTLERPAVQSAPPPPKKSRLSSCNFSQLLL